MYSSNYNLKNPMVVDPGIEIPTLTINIWRCTQNYYDRIEKPDPATCYVITDSVDGRVYHGSVMVLPEKHKIRYFMGINERSEWVIYFYKEVRRNSQLIEICRYTNPEIALQTLIELNRVGSHHGINIKVYNNLISYINGEVTLNNTIIGMISCFGYQDDPELQILISRTIYHNIETENYGHQSYRDMLFLFQQLAAGGNLLYQYYCKIYGIFKKNNFFKKEMEISDKTEIDLSEVVDQIVKIMM